MTKHQASPQFRIISRERTLEEAAALSILSPSPEHNANLIAAIRQYTEELRAARAARYGDILTSASAGRD